MPMLGLCVRGGKKIMRYQFGIVCTAVILMIGCGVNSGTETNSAEAAKGVLAYVDSNGLEIGNAADVAALKSVESVPGVQRLSWNAQTGRFEFAKIMEIDNGDSSGGGGGGSCPGGSCSASSNAGGSCKVSCSAGYSAVCMWQPLSCYCAPCS